MPQVIVEYSDNIIEKDKIRVVCSKINHYLAQALPADLSACKTRAIAHSVYCIGDGEVNKAFVHVTVKVISGRSQEKLNTVGLQLMDAFKQYFSLSKEKLNLQITLEIGELANTYFK